MGTSSEDRTSRTPIDAITDPPATHDASYPRRQVVSTMAGLLLALLFSSLDGTIVNTAMPRIVGEFHGFDRYTWVATAYLLTATVVIPIYGKLSDLIGRKVIFLFCLVIFLLGSALCGMARSMDQLIAFRAFQGLGAGGIMPVAMAAFADLLSPKERARWQGAFMAMLGISTILGPILGGWITDHASWRWIFYVNLPLGLCALVVLILLMPPLRHSDARPQIDLLGALLLILGVVPVLLGLTWAGSVNPWLSWQTMGLLAGGILVISLFIAHQRALERRGGEPIIAPSLFANRAFSVSLLSIMIAFMGMVGCLAFLPLYAQGVLRVSATSSGLVLTPLMLGVIASSVAGGALAARSGAYRTIAIAGMALGVAGGGLLLRLDLHTGYADMVVALVALGLGLGCGFAIYGTIVMNALPARQRGQGMASFDFFQEMGGPLALSVLGPLLAGRYGPAYRAALDARDMPGMPGSLVHSFETPDILLSPPALRALTAQFAGDRRALLTAVLDAVRIGLAQSIHTVFLSSFAILIAGFLVVQLLPHIEIHDASAEAAPGADNSAVGAAAARRTA